MNPFDDVAKALEALTSGLGGIAVLVAGIGALAMAVIEAVKAMLPLRAKFHHDEIERWLKGEHASADMKLMGVGFDELPSADKPESALTELLRLAIGSGPDLRFGNLSNSLIGTQEFADSLK